MNRFATLICLVVLTVASSTANAATQFYSTYSKNNVPAIECVQASAIVTPLIAKFKGPTDWTFIIVCDEAAWQRVMVHIGQQESSKGLILGTTDRDSKVTYIRGFYVLSPYNTEADAQPEHTVAHELGHIMANTSNEAKAERKAQELLSGGLVAKAGN
jgi:hypothetical protein